MKTTNFRGFRVETIPATDSKPVRIKVKDLRYDKRVILSYGANHNEIEDVLNDFFNSKQIEITGKCWHEHKGQIHTYSIYLTTNYTNQIK